MVSPTTALHFMLRFDSDPDPERGMKTRGRENRLFCIQFLVFLHPFSRVRSTIVLRFSLLCCEEQFRGLAFLSYPLAEHSVGTL
jgi:hypothetical protein